MSAESIDADRIERVAVALGLAMKLGNIEPYSLAVALEVAGLLAAPPVTDLATAVDVMGALPMPTGAPSPSPWERAVAGLNALADAKVTFWIEPDGHISNPFGDEHIEWDQDASRWRLVHDDEDAAPAPGALDKRPPTIDDIVRALHTKDTDWVHCEHDGEVWPCPTLAALDRTNIPAQRDQRGQA